MEPIDDSGIPQVEDSGSDGNQSEVPLTGQVLHPTDSPYPDEAVNAQLAAMMSSNSRGFTQQQTQNLLLARQLDQSATITQERQENARLTDQISEKDARISRLSVEVATLKEKKFSS